MAFAYSASGSARGFCCWRTGRVLQPLACTHKILSVRVHSANREPWKRQLAAWSPPGSGLCVQQSHSLISTCNCGTTCCQQGRRIRLRTAPVLCPFYYSSSVVPCPRSATGMIVAVVGLVLSQQHPAHCHGLAADRRLRLCEATPGCSCGRLALPTTTEGV
jgi:hypothetical protein